MDKYWRILPSFYGLLEQSLYIGRGFIPLSLGNFVDDVLRIQNLFWNGKLNGNPDRHLDISTALSFGVRCLSFLSPLIGLLDSHFNLL